MGSGKQRRERLKQWLSRNESRSLNSPLDYGSSHLNCESNLTFQTCHVDNFELASTATNNSSPGIPTSTRHPCASSLPTASDAIPKKDVKCSSAGQDDEDLWGVARQKLHVDEQKVLESNVEFGPTYDIMNQIQRLVDEKKRLMNEKAWKIEIGGRSFVLREVAEKIAGWIKVFKDIGDTVIQVDPIHSALPWAAIKLIMMIATADVEQAGQILICVELTACLISRCKIYETLYLDTDLEESKDGELELKNSIVQAYRAILSFLVLYIKQTRSNSFTKKIVATLNPGQLNEMVTDLSKYHSQCEAAARICESQMNRSFRDRQEAAQKKQHKMLRKYFDRVNAQSPKYWQILADDERCNILQWISGIPFESDHYIAAQGRVEGTGDWLLSHPVFRSWRNKDKSTILWLNGIPGAGKTKLSSKVIDSLRRTTDNQTNEGLAYFYCDRNRLDHRDPVAVLQSFVRQLSTPGNKSSIISYIEDRYTTQKRYGFPKGHLTSEECQDLLLRLAHDYAPMNLIVDGLDECDRDTRHILMNVLDLLVAKSNHPVKILIASRQDQDLRDHYRPGDHLEITATDNQADIEKFVLSKLEQSPFYQRKMSQEVQQKILLTFQVKSQGMFQWAVLHIDELLKMNRNKDILNYLDKLPKGLMAAYEAIVKDIASQPGSKPEIAFSAFKILMSSWRPLSPSEMVIAVTQRIDEDFHIEHDVDISYVLDACCNFMVVASGPPETPTDSEDEIENIIWNKSKHLWEIEYEDSPKVLRTRRRRKSKAATSGVNGIWEENAICRFAHLSIQEYLELKHWQAPEAHAHIACICLGTLLQLQWGGKLHQGRSVDSQHYRTTNHESEISDACALDLEPRKVILAGQQTQTSTNWPEEDESAYQRKLTAQPSMRATSDSQPKPVSGFDKSSHIFFISDTCMENSEFTASGFCLLCKRSVEEHDHCPLETWVKYASEMWSLHFRHARRHTSVQATMDGLLQRFLGTYTASSRAYRSWICFNQGKIGFIVDQRINSWDQPEHLTSVSICDILERQLLMSISDPILACALLGLDHVLAKWLEAEPTIAKRVNVPGHTLLLLAVQGRHYSACKTLLLHGADPNKTGVSELSVLDIAIYWQLPSIVKLLLEHGANPNRYRLLYKTPWDPIEKVYPLYTAVLMPEAHKIVELLLDYDADVLQTGALHVAIKHNDLRSIRLLLDAIMKAERSDLTCGRRFEIRHFVEKAWGAALMDERDNIDVLETFLDRDLDMPANDSMHVVAAAGKVNSIKWLIAQDLDVNQRSRQPRRREEDTPLLYCIRESIKPISHDHLLAVQTLVDAGARIEDTDIDGFTALQLALEAGREDIAAYLLEVGADITTKTSKGATTLTLACRYASPSMVSQLLDLGVDAKEKASPGAHELFPMYGAYQREWTGTNSELKHEEDRYTIMSLLVKAGALYKVEDFTEELIQSLGKQTLQDMETEVKKVMSDTSRGPELGLTDALGRP